MLRGVEQLGIQAFRIAVRAVGRVGNSVPERIILGGISQIVFVAQLKGVAAFQVPEVVHLVREDDSVISGVLQVRAHGILQDPGDAALGGGDRHHDGIAFRVVIGLRIAEVALLADLGRRGDLPAFDLLELVRAGSLRHHDLLHVLIGVRRCMAGIEQVVGILHLHHRSGADPAVLPAAAAALHDGIIVFRIGHKVLRGRQVNGVVVGIPALLQVIDVIRPVLIVGHRVADVRLVDSVYRRPEKDSVLICRLLASRGSQG